MISGSEMLECVQFHNSDSSAPCINYVVARSTPAKYPIQIKRRADQAKMCESLREIAECLSLRSCLLGVESEMVGVTQHAFEQEPRLIELLRYGLTRAGQRFHKPEGAHVERALLARKPVNAGLCRVAVHEAVADETTLARA